MVAEQDRKHVERMLVELIDKHGPMTADEIEETTGIGKWQIARYADGSDVLIRRRVHRPSAHDPHKKVRIISTVDRCSKCGRKHDE